MAIIRQYYTEINVNYTQRLTQKSVYNVNRQYTGNSVIYNHSKGTRDATGGRVHGPDGLSSISGGCDRWTGNGPDALSIIRQSLKITRRKEL